MDQTTQKVADYCEKHFTTTLLKAGPEFSYLGKHLPLVIKWAKRLLQLYPYANKEVVMSAVWLHDIGQMIGDKNIDHAINSENEVNRLFSEAGISKEIMDKTAHCARAHRCKDVQPETLEAKIVAVSDSASHMTDYVYVSMITTQGKGAALGKLERDYRDIRLLPELKNELTELYSAWKHLLDVFPVME